MSENAGWNARHSSDYIGKRFVVDGDLIELYAYEYGDFQPDIAKRFHAEPLKEYESRWLDGWVKHHDGMLRRTCDALEAENAKLRKLVDAWMGCGTRYHTMKGACPMFDESAKDFCKAEQMAYELGIEVGHDT